MRKKLGLAFLLSLGIVATTALGFSSWVIPALDFAATPTVEEAVAVAYLKNDSGTQYFTNIEGAVAKANAGPGNQEVFVIPGISMEDASKPNPIVINEDVTIGSNVSLILPYDGETYETLQISGGTSSDITVENRRANLRTEVLLGDGCTLTINAGGKLIVGGEIGFNSPCAGTVLGKFCQISMGLNAKIDCFGTMIVNGFIKPYDEMYENNEDTRPRVILRNGASARVPMQIYDFSSGSTSLDYYSDGIFPFNVFDMPNVTTMFEIDYGSVLTGLTSFMFSKFGITAWFQPNIELVSPNSSAVICLQQGDLSYDYQPASTYQLSGLTRGLSDIKRGSLSVTTYFVNGSCAINNLVVKLDATDEAIAFFIQMLGFSTISTDGLFIPFSYKWDIRLTEGSTCTFPSNISTKFLPGAKFELGPNSVWNVEGKAAFYRESYSFNGYPTSLEEAIVENSGTINVFGALAGRILGKCEGSVVNFNSGSSCSLTVNDATATISIDASTDFSISGSLSLDRNFSSYGGTGKFTSIEYVDGGETLYPYVPNDLQLVSVTVRRNDAFGDTSFGLTIGSDTYSSNDLPLENVSVIGGTDVSFTNCVNVAYVVYGGEYYLPDISGAINVPASMNGDIVVHGVGPSSAQSVEIAMNDNGTMFNDPGQLSFTYTVNAASAGGSMEKITSGTISVTYKTFLGAKVGWSIDHLNSLPDPNKIKAGSIIEIAYVKGLATSLEVTTGASSLKELGNNKYLVLDVSQSSQIVFTFRR